VPVRREASTTMMKRPWMVRLTLWKAGTDEEAMWRVRTEGDHEEFARLVRRWQDPIRRLCARMTGDVHRAEDLKQEAFLRIFAKRGDYRAGARFSTWLWRVALNVCYDEIRRRTRAQKLGLEGPGAEGEAANEVPAEEPTPDRTAAQQEEGELVRQALMRLPEIYRAVLVLRHYEGLKLGKIAEILEIPEGTVNSRMAGALTRLGELLEPQLKRSPSLRLMPARATGAISKESVVI
jgi:RNA polymerase sigma-70 factor (ECF subfamily)